MLFALVEMLKSFANVMWKLHKWMQIFIR